jgi:hypothetical protein
LPWIIYTHSLGRKNPKPAFFHHQFLFQPSKIFIAAGQSKSNGQFIGG